MATITFRKRTGIDSITLWVVQLDGTEKEVELDSSSSRKVVDNVNTNEGISIESLDASTGYKTGTVIIYNSVQDIDEVIDFDQEGDHTVNIYGNPKAYDVTYTLGAGLQSAVAVYDGSSEEFDDSITFKDVYTGDDFYVTFNKDSYDLDHYYGHPVKKSGDSTGEWDSDGDISGDYWFWSYGGGTVTFKATNYDPGTPTLEITAISQTKIEFSSEDISKYFDGKNPIYLKQGTQLIDDAVIYRTKNGTSTGSFDNLSLNALIPYSIEAEFVHSYSDEFDVDWNKTLTETIIITPKLEMNWDNDSSTEDTIATATSAILTIHTPKGIGEATYSVSIKKKNSSSSTSVVKNEEIGSNLSDTKTVNIPNLIHNTPYIITVDYTLLSGEKVSDTIAFTTLNAYTINVELNNLNHIYVETEDMEDVYVSHKGTFLVIPGETFTVSFPKNKTGTSAFTAYSQTHDEGKKATYYWPYGFPVKAEGIKDKETSRILSNPGEASYLVGTSETENGKTYTFTAYPSGWTGWTDTEKPKAGQQTTTFSVESWNKLVNCLDAWNAFCGQSAVSDTFMPQNGSYNFTATIYNKIYDELTNLFTVNENFPIMPRVEIGKERQTEVSASRLINIGNNIKYANLGKDYQ